jgi:deoxyribonuclease V
MWPTHADDLVAEQLRLAGTQPERWTPSAGPVHVGGCWVCFPRGLTGSGSEGDPAWAAAVAMSGPGPVAEHVMAGTAGAPYLPGLLALRVGPLLEGAVRGLAKRPDVMLLDATGRDHPRRFGLALHLGAVLELPTVGVTHRPLLAEGGWPADRPGATSLLRIGETVVAGWLRTSPGTRPLVVHPGWKTDLATAIEIVGMTSAQRTPQPLRRARYLARHSRAASSRISS